MDVFITADKISLSVPLFLQHEREAKNWGSLFFGALFDPPRRQLAHLLDKLSFKLREGDRVALLGQNGAGKSTLLKVLNGAYTPTSGDITVRGNSQALLNISLGFNGEATVRENIFLRGTAMGLRNSHLREHINEILDFADLPDKVNHRLRTLSSGQRMRLGFAISTSVQQDILLMDEWVGTGDANFMAKAKERLQSRMAGSKIVVLASHSVGLLREICNKGMVLDNGKLLFFGDIAESIEFYHELLAAQWAYGSQTFSKVSALAGNGGQLVYGYVDRVLMRSAGELQLKGWAACTGGAQPGHLVLETKDAAHPLTDIKWSNRPDVVKRFGLSNGKCGFQATVKIPQLRAVAELGVDMRVSAAVDKDKVLMPLRLADRVLAGLQMSALPAAGVP